MKPTFFNVKLLAALIIVLAFALIDKAVAGADLTPTFIYISGRPNDNIYHPDDSIDIEWRVSNIGDETSDGYTADFYADGYYIGSESSSGLEAGMEDGGSTSCSLPSDMSYGTYHVSVEISCSNDTNSSNNEREDGWGFFCAEEKPPAPDLRVVATDVSGRPDDNRFYPGDSITIHVVIENMGEQTSDSYTVDVYADSYYLGSESGSGLEPGEDERMWISCSLPDDIGEGWYTISSELSTSNDEDTGNNSDSDAWPIRVAYKAPPEITINNVDATEGVYKPGDSIIVDIGVESGEGQLSGNIEFDIYASIDTDISNTDYKINSEGFSLEPDGSYTFNSTCRFPSDIPDGYYYIGIIVTDPENGSTCYDQSPVWVSRPMDASVQTVRTTAGTYSPDDEIKVYSLVKNVGQRTTESYVVDYYLSADESITTDDYKIGYVNRNGLPPGQQHSYETTCRIPLNVPAGKWYIGIIVTCPKDYDVTNNMGLATTTIEVTHPAGYVCGQATYKDIWNEKHPIRYALVEVHAKDNNDDPLDDPLLGQTYTNSGGLYGLILANDENFSQDIYVKILTEGVSGAYPETTSKICTLKDDVLNETYSLVSDTYPHPGDSSVIIDMTAPYYDDEGGEFMVFDSIVEGFHKARTYLNIEIEEAAVYWPSEAETSYFDPCDAGIYISQDDRGDRDVIMHEYGHYIADIYGIAQGPVGDDSGHYWDKDLRLEPTSRTDEQGMNLAFREAWASLFSIATQYGDKWYPKSGDSYYDDYDEESDWTLRVNLDNEGEEKFSPGQYFENMNAGALWDIFDDKNDKSDRKDTLNDPSLEKIWTISRDYKPESILDFWNDWFNKYEYEEEMNYIFEIHKMPQEKSEPESSTNRPPVADAGEDVTVYQTCRDGAAVYLSSENSYDPDGDELMDYRWEAYWSGGGWAKQRGVDATFVLPPGDTTVMLYLSDGIEEVSDEVIVTVIATDPSTWDELSCR